MIIVRLASSAMAGDYIWAVGSAQECSSVIGVPIEWNM